MDNGKTGTLIAARRKELGMTQKELAEKLHISDRTVSKWERGAGFPDVSLLEPLAETLDLSILDLVQGEHRQEPPTEVTVRSVITSIGAHMRKTTRQQLTTAAASLFLLAMSAFILFGIADSLGAFDQKVSMVLSAGIYVEGVFIEETTVTIEGSRHRLTGDYYGRFAIAAIPETCAEDVHARIQWDDQFEGHHELRFSRFGQTWIEGPLSRADIYISKEMGLFAFRMEDGRVIATHEHLVPLAMLDYYYPVDLRNVKYLPIP